MKKEKVEFLLNLFEREKLPDCYSNIYYSQNSEILYTSKNTEDLSKLYSVKWVPEYIVYDLNPNHHVKIRKINQFNRGYSISLERCSDSNTYLKSQFKNKAKTIRRYLTRLETCFSINYKMFYGDINKEEYNFLLISLKKMLEIRFEQKKQKNDRLEEWSRFYKMFFSLINNNKASIYVIYNEKTPIAISLNYNLNNTILFSAISSYDIDYAKFGLGHIDIYKQLDWCILNNYDLFEMGWGDSDYKRRWSNYIYKYDYHIIYSKKSFSSSLFGNFEFIKIRIKEYLISRGVNLIYTQIKSIGKKRNTSVAENKNYEILPLDSKETYSDLVLINHKLEDYFYLKKIIYDFSYSNVQHMNEIKVYELSKNVRSYLIKGKNHSQKVIFY